MAADLSDTCDYLEKVGRQSAEIVFQNVIGWKVINLSRELFLDFFVQLKMSFLSYFDF